MKDKILKAMQSKKCWVALISLLTGLCMQFGLIDLGQQINTVMGLFITFAITVGIVHDNEKKEPLPASDVEKGVVE